MENDITNIAQKEFDISNGKNISSDISKMYGDIISSKGNTSYSNMYPKDFNPNNGLLFGVSAASPVKPTLETKVYDINQAYVPLSDGTYVAKFDTFKRGRDNEEYFAKTQSTGEKWANGATKFLAKTGSAVVGGTVGLVYGVGAAISDGSFSSIYDNSFSNTLEDWNTKLSYELPNWYTKQEKDLGFVGQMGTANFWSDKFLGGLSFTAGAIISEGIWAYATGGLSLSTVGARLGSLGRLGRAVEVGAEAANAGKWGVKALGEANALKGISKYKSLYTDMLNNSVEAGRISKTLANRLGKTGELISATGVLARSAGYEASVEALQFRREAEENFFDNFYAINGREPNTDEIKEFRNNLENASNSVFTTNMAILMPSNLVMMGNILEVKSPFKLGIGEYLDKKLFGYGIEKTVGEEGKAVYKTLEATTKQKIARTGYNYFIKPSLSEGIFEEGGQGVTTKYFNKWLEHTYDDKYSHGNLDKIGDFYESLSEQYGTKEGWVEVGLGMLIGIAGGASNTRSEMKERKESLEYKTAVSNVFGTDNLQSLILPNRLQSLNRIQGFTEDAKKEAQKGNLAKSQLSQQSALLTFINAKLIMGESISDFTKEIKISLDSITEDQWKEAGIESSDIEAFKDEKLRDFTQLAKDWKANKTYWTYVIGKQIAGENDIDASLIEDTLGGLGSKTNAVIEALTWQSTIGEVANKQMKEAKDLITRELGEELSNTIELNSRLRQESRELKGSINVASRNYKIEKDRRDKLIAKIAKVNAKPTEANKPAGKQLGVLNEELLKSEQRLVELENELNGYAEKINKTTAYQSNLEGLDFSSQDISSNIISGQDLISLQDNVNKFNDILSGFEHSNPQRYSYLQEILKEYSDYENIFLQNQVSQRATFNKDFKIDKINSWIEGKMKRKASLNENTKEWFNDVLQSYQKAKIESAADQVAVAEETPSEVIVEDKKEVKPKEVVKEESTLTPVESYKKKIADALSGTHNYLAYLGDNYDDVANKKPTTEEVEEFQKLREEGDTTSDRYKELYQKLSDWKLLNSAVDEDYVSIGDLIIGLEQLENNVVDDTLTEITPEHTQDIIDEEDIPTTSNVYKPNITNNTNGAVTVKKPREGVLTFHHLKLATIASKLGGDFTLKDKDGKQIYFGEEAPGTVLTIRGIEFEVVNGNAIQINEDEFNSLRDDLNMYPIDTGSVNWSYSDVYTKVGDEYVKMDSDFWQQDLEPEHIYNLKEGDVLDVLISNDGYNDKLLEEYNKNKKKNEKEALKILRDNLKLTLQTTSGVIAEVSMLKANGNTVNEQMLRIRQKAVERYLEASDKTDIKLGISVKVDGIFLGSPRFTITSEGKVENKEITERGAKEIISTGYILDGEVKLSREVGEVNTTYVGRISKNNTGIKVPIIIVKRGIHNIAYPVSMNKTNTSRIDIFDSIMNMRISPQDKIIRLNNEIIKYGIKTDKLTYSDINNSQKLEDIKNAFNNVEDFLSVEDFSNKNYNLDNVQNDIKVNIDLENLNGIITDAKLKIKLDDSVIIKTDRDTKYESMTELEDNLSNIAIELDKDLRNNAHIKYVDKNGDVLEDEGYIETFDDKPTIKPQNQLDKLHNVNVLKEAFSKMSKKIKNILGEETVNKVENLIKEYDNIKKQIIALKDDVNSGNKNSCK